MNERWRADSEWSERMGQMSVNRCVKIGVVTEEDGGRMVTKEREGQR